MVIMIIKAGTDLGIRSRLINYDGIEITNVNSFDTETNEAMMFLSNNKNQFIADENKKPLLIKVHLPLAKIVTEKRNDQ